MASPYYLPAGLLPFQDWNNNFDTLISTNPTRYGLTAPLAAGHASLTGNFNNALAVSTAPSTRTPVTVAATNIAFNAVRVSAQNLVQIAQASGLLTETIAAEIAVTFRDKIKTPIPPPTQIPTLAMESITPFQSVFRIKEAGADNNRIPAGCVGYQVAVAIAPVNPPTSPDELTLIGNGTKRFYTVPYSGLDGGKTTYTAVRYVNARQAVGPWSNIITSTIVNA